MKRFCNNCQRETEHKQEPFLITMPRSAPTGLQDLTGRTLPPPDNPVSVPNSIRYTCLACGHVTIDIGNIGQAATEFDKLARGEDWTNPPF